MNYKEYENALENAPTLAILDSLVKAETTLKKYKNIAVSISGGSDSDIILDIISKMPFTNNVIFVWFDTGLEFQATKEHLLFLEKKYGIEIKRERAIKPIPNTCKEYGQPFVSKYVSEQIARLQKHNFKWENEPFELLIKKYPRCRSALKWWCNKHGEKSNFNINRNIKLKEFLIHNPPTFKISNKCCLYAKKKVALNFIKENKINLNIVGIRKYEGGIRSQAYKTCFDNKEEVANYRPIFWYKNNDKIKYNETFNVTNSRCYSEYGMTRTGCAGCPYSKDFEEELKIIETYEPKLFKAVNNIFGDSYNYTRLYKKYINSNTMAVNEK